MSLRLGWAMAVALWLAAAAWIAAHPVTPGSDDALFLLRGLTRFSVLEFRPQFPGYPGMVAMGRLLLPFVPTPEAAMALLAAAIALALPAVSALVVARQHGVAPWRSGAALAVFLAVLGQPLMPDLALSRLTDGAGILFVLVFLALLPRGRAPSHGWRARGFRASALPSSALPSSALPSSALPSSALPAGIALGWAAACRPSDAILILSVAGGAIAAQPALWRGLGTGFALVIAPVAAFLLIHEPLYLREGLRFTEGHALIWGNTPFSDLPRPATWPETVQRIPGGWLLLGLLALGALLALRRGGHQDRAARWATGAGFVGHALWTWGFQNPESLRHLAPLLVLGPVIWGLQLPGLPARIVMGPVMGLGAAGLALTAAPDPRAAAPSQRVATWASATDATLATNEGVSLLRAALPNARIYDQHYRADAALGLQLAPGAAFRISYTALPGRRPAQVFPRRFAGEHTLYAYARPPADQISGRRSGLSASVRPTFASASGLATFSDPSVQRARPRWRSRASVLLVCTSDSPSESARSC